VHRGVGAAATVWAALIGVSTLYTKQHYVADVIAGALIALVAYAIFLRGHRRNTLSERETRRAPVRALIAAVAFAATVAGCWVVYRVAPADRAAQELAAVRGTRRVPW
jgi:NADH:ubiquinone oxidoreductase subunit 6 (subunit J)